MDERVIVILRTFRVLSVQIDCAQVEARGLSWKE